MTSKADEKTVRVCVAVVVGDDGDYSAVGWRLDPRDVAKPQQNLMVARATELLDGEMSGAEALNRVVWIEADVPLPVAPTVEAEVQS